MDTGRYGFKHGCRESITDEKPEAVAKSPIKCVHWKRNVTVFGLKETPSKEIGREFYSFMTCL